MNKDKDFACKWVSYNKKTKEFTLINGKKTINIDRAKKHARKLAELWQNNLSNIGTGLYK